MDKQTSSTGGNVSAATIAGRTLGQPAGQSLPAEFLAMLAQIERSNR